MGIPEFVASWSEVAGNPAAMAGVWSKGREGIWQAFQRGLWWEGLGDSRARCGAEEGEEWGWTEQLVGFWLADRESAPEESSDILLEFMGNHCSARSNLHQSSSIDTEKLSPELMSLYDAKQFVQLLFTKFTGYLGTSFL